MRLYTSGLLGELEGSSSSDTQSTEEPIASDTASPTDDHHHRVVISAERDRDGDGVNSNGLGEKNGTKIPADVISGGSTGTKASSKERRKKKRCVIM
jgi:hypothetical protein